MAGLATAKPTEIATTCRILTGEPSFDADAEVQTWEGQLDPGTPGGELEVRSEGGGIYVTPWSRDAWRVDIGKVDPWDRLDAGVKASQADGVFSLTVVVKPKDDTLPIPLERVAGRSQVKVWVPNRSFERLETSDRMDASSYRSFTIPDDTSSSWSDLRVGNLKVGDVRLHSENLDVHAYDLDVGVLSVQTDNGDVRLANASARSVGLSTHNGDLCIAGLGSTTLKGEAGNGEVLVESVQIQNLSVQAGNGDARVINATADGLNLIVGNGIARMMGVHASQLTVSAGSGDVLFQDVHVHNFDVNNQNGDIHANLLPVASGRWSLQSQNGGIALRVPTGLQQGYDLRLRTVNGQVNATLAEAEVVSQTEKDVHVQTSDYGKRGIQTRVTLQSQNGDVTADSLPAAVAASSGFERPLRIGAMAALAAFLWFLLPKLKVLGAALYSRLHTPELLNHEMRRAIHEAVSVEPGIHFQELRRRVRAGRGILEHHLNKLVAAGILNEKNARGYRCYFPPGTDGAIMDVADRLRAPSAQNLMAALANRPGASLSELAKRAGMNRATAAYHLDRFGQAGLLQKSRSGDGLGVELTDFGSRAVGRLLPTLDFPSKNRA